MLKINQDTLMRSLLQRGNTDRIRAVFARAERGEPITLATLGGSITQGAGAGERELCYASLIRDHLANMFPKSEVTLCNAGIGATGSAIGCYRLASDVISKKPDLVTVEYAVNDAEPPKGSNRSETFEAIVRRLLKLGIAVAVFFFPREVRNDASRDHFKVARHYSLPVVSVTDAFEPMQNSGEYAWSDYSGDEVHPNVDGHAFIASLVSAFFDSVYSEGVRASPAEFTMPEPLYGELYDNATMLAPADITPTEFGDFKPEQAVFYQFPTGWLGCGDKPMTIELDDCRTLMLLLHRSVNPEYGIARITVESDGESRELTADCRFPNGWGDYSMPIHLMRSETPKKVRVTLKADGGRVGLLRIMKS